MYPLKLTLNELKTQNSLGRSRDAGMPAQLLVAGTVVRGKTKAVLNKQGIIESVIGNQFTVKWVGATCTSPSQAFRCTTCL